MCGFAGCLSSSMRAEQSYSVLQNMATTLLHRGPDEDGIWLDLEGGVGFAHRRLKIVELSDKGKQPMMSQTGRFVLVYNGEIYNYRPLRRLLQEEGIIFLGDSDTEVVLNALASWGVQSALSQFVGMFAFALWDRVEKKLVLARDRFGEKPLYYGQQGDAFLFGSTLAPLSCHPAWQGRINRQALAGFVGRNYIPAPLSIYDDIYKLMPGTWLEVTQNKNGRWQEQTQTYWSAIETAYNAYSHPFEGGAKEARDNLENLLAQAIEGQLQADVPLGAFLSGGVDSSTIVALAHKLSSSPLKTFTIGFEHSAYDESKHAEAVAHYLGTDHTSCILTQKDILDLLPTISTMYDEPFADASQLPTALISKIARAHVTVALSGDGGDEIFAGYNRYLIAPSLYNKMSFLPSALRLWAGQMGRNISPTMWDRISMILPSPFRARLMGEKIHKSCRTMMARSVEEMYYTLTSFWHDDFPVIGADADRHSMMPDIWQSSLSVAQKMRLADTVSYLPDDILTKVDRASMAFSLEARVPFLDHRLFEFVWSLPENYLIKGKKGKSILRDILYRHVPKTLIERPKTGFAVPIGYYLRGPLRDWAEDMLAPARLKRQGFFDPAKVRKIWDIQSSGKQNLQHELWSVLMFQSWLER